MPNCSLCNKTLEQGNDMFFTVPKDKKKRIKWSEICEKEFSLNDLICSDHFSSSDIVKDYKTSLTNNAVPFVRRHDESSQITLMDETKIRTTALEKYKSQDLVLCNSTEYVNINTSIPEDKQKCRCCTNSSENFIQLDFSIKTTEGMEKTFKDLLYDITKFKLSSYQENNMPQQICQKCAAQLKKCYKYIQQVVKVTEQYLAAVDQIHAQEIKNVEHLQEKLIEISPALSSQLTPAEIKIEPLNIECDIEIKEEKVETEVFKLIVPNTEESLEERNLLNDSNIDEASSDDKESSHEAESVKSDITTEFNDASIARSCDICHKVYRDEKFLNIHKRYSHMPEEDKLPCPLCSYKTSRSSALKVHMGLVHGHDKMDEYFKPVMDSSKKYPCKLCPRSYSRNDSLQKHVRRKHLHKPSKDDNTKKKKQTQFKEKKVFLCSYCGQSYGSKFCLQSHILIHTGERPFSCEICCKTFKTSKDLHLHRVIHSDEKPHQCSECGKAFKRVDKLKIHMIVHSELRPYKCTECEKTFKYHSVLKTHMNIHTGETPFSCKTCGEEFSLRTSLNNHCLKNGHSK